MNRGDIALFNSHGAAHAHGWPSIENPERLKHVDDALRAACLFERCTERKGHRATDDELHTVHHLAVGLAPGQHRTWKSLQVRLATRHSQQ